MQYSFAIPGRWRHSAALTLSGRFDLPLTLEALDLEEVNRPRLHAALDIYSSEIMAEARSPIEHLEYWINRSEEYLSDKFRCFSIHGDDGVIGYLQYTYFS